MPAAADFFDAASVADLLEEQAKGLTPESASVVGHLANDLRDGARLDRWTGVDLVAMLARPEHVADAGAGSGASGSPSPSSLRHRLRRVLPDGSAGWERGFEAVLGVFVFVPLLLTWLGMALAARAYGQLAAGDKTQATRPFLQLWESGFDGRLKPLFRFGDVAVFAVIFISMLLLLSIFHSLVRHRAQTVADRRLQSAAEQAGRLAIALAGAQIVLNARRTDTPEGVAATLGEAAEVLRKLIQQAAAAQTASTKALDRASDLAGSLGDTAVRVADASVAASNRMSAAAATAADRLTKASSETSRRLTEASAASADRMADASRAAAGASVAATEAVESGVAALHQAHQDTAAALTVLVRDGAASLRDVHEAGLTAARESAGQTRDVLRDGMGLLRAGSDAVADAVATVRDSVTDSTTRVTAAVDGLGDRARAAGERVESSIDHLAEAQRRLDQRSETVVRAADDVVDALRGVTRETAGSMQQLGLAAEHWESAAQHWDRAAATIERRAQAGLHADGPAERWHSPNGTGRGLHDGDIPTPRNGAADIASPDAGTGGGAGTAGSGERP